jgi:hypothetical protein
MGRNTVQYLGSGRRFGVVKSLMPVRRNSELNFGRYFVHMLELMQKPTVRQLFAGGVDGFISVSRQVVCWGRACPDITWRVDHSWKCRRSQRMGGVSHDPVFSISLSLSLSLSLYLSLLFFEYLRRVRGASGQLIIVLLRSVSCVFL